MEAPASPSHQMASESFIVPSESLTASTLDPHPAPDSPSAESQGLLEALEQAHAALAQSRSENDDLKEQLEASQRQVQDQSDQIAMLRGKVEEARRGVMRLQTENRRSSHLQLASTQDGVVGLRSSKRASFILPPTPASPGGASSAGKHIHRRISR
jgi:TolA-binding protein